MKQVSVFEPQPGFQTNVLACSADVLICGGSAGCGKTRALLMEPIRHVHVPGMTTICFRREYRQIDSPGGLWEKSVELYTKLPRQFFPRIVAGDLKYYFPHGHVMAFDHLNNDMSVSKYDGPEFALIEFDELIHFTEYQFRYMMGRNRSTCGVRPYIRTATNPQGFGWVKDFISWFIYPDDYHIESLQGAPIPERSGVLRFFAAYDDRWIFGDTPDEVLNQLPPSLRIRPEAIRTMTFIGGRLPDNQALMQADPGYEGALLSLPEKDRIRLVDGRWIDPTRGERRLFLDGPIRDMFSNSFVRGTGERFITADIAFSKDRFVIIVWDGWVVVDIEVRNQTDSPAVVAHIENAASRWGVPGRNIAFDSGGLGGFLTGYLATAFPFFGAAAPIDNENKTDVQRQGLRRPAFENLRAQCFWLLKDRLEDCSIYFAVRGVHLHDEIYQELAVVKRVGDNDDDKIQIIPKEEMRAVLKRSPDLADTLSMRAVFDLLPNTIRTPRTIRSM